jgi:predicted Zn-ribbon and HTH transcriptional regulator
MKDHDAGAPPLRELRRTLLDQLSGFGDDARGPTAAQLAEKAGAIIGTVRRELDGMRISGLVTRQAAQGRWTWHLTAKGKEKRAGAAVLPATCKECGQSLMPAATSCPECGTAVAP